MRTHLPPALCLAVCALVTGLPAAWAPADQPAYRADEFVDAIGLSTGAEGPTVERVVDLGVRHYRAILKYDLTPADQPDRFRALCDQHGLTAMMLVDPHKDGPPENVVALLKQYAPGVVDLVEFPNEVNNKFPPQELNLKYKGKIDEAAGAEYQSDYYAALKADPATRELGVVCYTAIFADYRDAKPCDAFDFANMHSYQGTGTPESSLLLNMLNFNNLLPDGGAIRPYVPTECGYNVSGNNGEDGCGTVRAQALNIPMLFAGYFRHGIRRLYLFNVVNVDGYGLLDSEGKERPAYTAMKEFLGLVKDADWDPAQHRWVGGDGFETRALRFAISGAPPSLRSLVLQKASGDWYLLLWNELPNYDAGARRDTTNAPVPVTLQFQTPLRPSVADWMQSEDGAHFRESALSVSEGSLVVQVPSSLIVLRLSPAQPVADIQAPAPPQDLAGKATPNEITVTWRPPSGAQGVAGYFVTRNGAFLGATTETSFLDRSPLIKPALGYSYEVQAYDAAGNVSAPMRAVIVTPNQRPDLILVELTTDPADPKPGDQVTFSGVVKNIGNGPTPQDTPLAIEFSVDGQFTSWSTTDGQRPLEPGQSVVLRANGGPRGTHLWTATQGAHVLKGHTDGGYQRIPGELSEYNNMRERSLLIASDTPGSLIGRMDPQPPVSDLTTEGTEDWVHWGHGGKEGVTHKRGGPGLFSALTKIGDGYMDSQPGCALGASWSDGDPTGSISNTHECLWWNCIGHGYSFNVPADAGWRTLRVWVAGLQSGCKLTARLSDDSAPEYVSTAWARGGEDSNIIHCQGWGAVYAFQYRAASADQTLTVAWTLADEQNRFLGQGQLQAAALSRGRQP
jgi:chitodextrinase